MSSREGDPVELRSGKTLEERVKQAGATGPRLTAAKQALRDSQIVARRAQGWHLDAIAAEAGVNERTVRRVLAEREAIGEALLDRDPIDVVRQMAAQLQASVADFEAMASAYSDVNPAAAIGAKKRPLGSRGGRAGPASPSGRPSGRSDHGICLAVQGGTGAAAPGRADPSIGARSPVMR